MSFDPMSFLGQWQSGQGQGQWQDGQGQGQNSILDLIRHLFPGVGGGTPQTGGSAQPPSPVPQQTPQQQFPAFRSGSPMPGILQRFGQQWPQLRQPVQPMANNPPPTGAPYHN